MTKLILPYWYVKTRGNVVRYLEQGTAVLCSFSGLHQLMRIRIFSILANVNLDPAFLKKVPVDPDLDKMSEKF
jgi:hypothetical protein